MRPKIRSSTEHRRRSLVATSEMTRQDSMRRSSVTATMQSTANSDSVSKLLSLSRNNSTNQTDVSNSEFDSSTPGPISPNQRNDSLTGVRSATHDMMAKRRVSAPVFSSFNGKTRQSLLLEKRNSSSLDCTRQDVNSFRIKILVASFIVALSLMMVLYYVRFRSVFVS